MKPSKSHISYRVCSRIRYNCTEVISSPAYRVDICLVALPLAFARDECSSARFGLNESD